MKAIDFIEENYTGKEYVAKRQFEGCSNSCNGPCEQECVSPLDENCCQCNDC